MEKKVRRPRAGRKEDGRKGKGSKEGKIDTVQERKKEIQRERGREGGRD
jgi:hypothetical protein